MATVIVLNSPARTGKDTALELLEGINDRVVGLSFKEPLIEATANFLGLPVNQFLMNYDKAMDDWYPSYNDSAVDRIEWVKDFPMYDVYGMVLSKRQALIHVSENVLKPLIGQDVFGKALAEKIEVGSRNIYVVTDGGFIDEFLPIIDKVGEHNFHLIHLEREGCSFEGDSRKLVTRKDLAELGVDMGGEYTIPNNGTKKQLRDKLFVSLCAIGGVF